MTHTWTPPAPVTTVCVAGMHRGGTSVASRTLHLLGVSLGSPDGLMPPGNDNQAGYWENKAIKEFDDELLAHLGGAWDQPPVLRAGWHHDAGLDPFRDQAAAILDVTFGPDDLGSGLIGFKDPRLSLLLPFWRTVLPIETTIVMVRDPREVAASLGARKVKVEPDQAMLLWMRYLFAAQANDPGHLLLRHRDFFDDLPGTLGRITRHLGRPDADPATVAAVHDHLDPSLHHHVATDAADDPGPVSPLTRLALDVWNQGRPELGTLPDAVTDAVAFGWLQAPLDDEALARARAQAVSLKEHLRKRNEELAALRARPEPSATPPPAASPTSSATAPERVSTEPGSPR